MTLATLEEFYDAVPRRFAGVEEVGPFTLFVGEPGGWSFHARPRLHGTDAFDAAAVHFLLERMRELGVPLAIEWVHDVTPGLLAAIEAEGSLQPTELPLLVLDGGPPVGPAPDGVELRMLGPEDEDLLRQVSGVTHLAFGRRTDPPAGHAERDELGRDASAGARAMLRTGESRIAVALDPERGVLATGRRLTVGSVAEIVGVATLPAEQGRGLGAAVTRLVVEDAVSAGVRTVFLTASSPRVAALYARLGFRRAGTAYAAAPA
jgi:ribosomal protein S18 acetylase RimI-like enzyme